MTNLCSVDGVITPEAEARVPVMDRGFLFGDSVYEVMRTRDGRPFAWREHLARLAKSADALRLPLPADPDEIVRRIGATLAASGSGERYVRVIVSRGTGSVPNIDLAYAPGPSRVVVLVRALAATPTEPARVLVVDRLRTDRRALDPAIKSGNYLNNVLGLAEARGAGATDCVFLNAQGLATEASTSNFFLVRRGELVTPPLTAGLLAGITRDLLFECARAERIAVHEADCTHDDLRGSDEMMLTSTLRDIVPVASLDGRKIGTGAPGPITHRLQMAFARFCARKATEQDGPAFDRICARNSGPLRAEP